MDTFYPNGVSTSLPKEAQEKMIRTMKGLRERNSKYSVTLSNMMLLIHFSIESNFRIYRNSLDYILPDKLMVLAAMKKLLGRV